MLQAGRVPLDLGAVLDQGRPGRGGVVPLGLELGGEQADGVPLLVEQVGDVAPLLAGAGDDLLDRLGVLLRRGRDRVERLDLNGPPLVERGGGDRLLRQ